MAGIITGIIFLLVVLVVLAVYYGTVAARESTRSEVKRKLRAIVLRQPTEEAMHPILKEEILSGIPLLNRLLYKVPIAAAVEELIEQADVKLRVGTFFLITVVSAALGLLVGLFISRGAIFTVVAAALFAVIPYGFLQRKKALRQRKFLELFPDTLDMIARSLRAGHSFTSAMQIVYQEMPEPVAKLFRMAYDEQNLGLSLSEALNNMTRRMRSLDLSFFVTTVNIQRETGGNLAEIFEKLGVTIRERFKILGQLRIYTAQGRISGYILAVIPFVVCFMIWLINPEYLKVLLVTRIGVYMICTALVLEIIGYFIIRKIINIRI